MATRSSTTKDPNERQILIDNIRFCIYPIHSRRSLILGMTLTKDFLPILASIFSLTSDSVNLKSFGEIMKSFDSEPFLDILDELMNITNIKVNGKLQVDIWEGAFKGRPDIYFRLAFEAIKEICPAFFTSASGLIQGSQTGQKIVNTIKSMEDLPAGVKELMEKF